MSTTKLTLTISCQDRVGLVAQVSSFLAKHHISIVEANHHTDQETNWFFMRHELVLDESNYPLSVFREEFAQLANTIDMTWDITPKSQKNRVVLLASKESHCLTDILHRWHEKELDCEVVAVIANHREMEKFASWYHLPFHHVDFKED